MKKVKCKECSNYNKKRCSVKKVKTSANKGRFCEDFILNTSKIVVKQQLPSEYVPHHMLNRKNYKKWIIERKKSELKASMEDKVSALSNPDVLARFRSSATK